MLFFNKKGLVLALYFRIISLPYLGDDPSRSSTPSTPWKIRGKFLFLRPCQLQAASMTSLSPMGYRTKISLLKVFFFFFHQNKKEDNRKNIN